ncbi:MAG TPA: helix-turn-helix domain-containing protein, partial [Bacteroidia bacterium]|nr:helix-turn-helix domain-containing protein [Bacteroidia bacterium]
MKLYIKNMACESCKIVVRDAIQKLKLHPVKVDLGEAEIKETISEKEKNKINTLIGEAGLALAENNSIILIEKIKKFILEYIDAEKAPRVKLSTYLSKNLHYDYNYISNLFSEIAAQTIIHYYNALRVERAKEMILFQQLSFTQIAEKLGYSSVSHF